MSSEIATLKAESRRRVGKGSSRALRRRGYIPAVIYGEKQPPLAIAVPFKESFMQIHAGGFRTKVVIIDTGAEKIRVLPKDYQLDPVKDTPLHIDFLRISEKSRVTVEVPVHFLNEESCVGLKQGGMLNIVRHQVELSALAGAIPESVNVDIQKYEIGDSIHISAVKLPENVELIIHDRDFTLATIAAPMTEKEEPAAAAAESAPEAKETKKADSKKTESK